MLVGAHYHRAPSDVLAGALALVGTVAWERSEWHVEPLVHLDCDPGHDDAVAILLGAYQGSVVSISTVGGNAPLPAVTENALLCTQLFGLEVPVGVGADRPLLRKASHAPEIHGEGGLAGPLTPALTRSVDRRDACELMLASAEANPGLWLVATGPMTNVAAALVAHPRLRDLIGGIAFMGGSTSFGNWTPAAEFNIWCDPEAAAVVLGSGVTPIRMVGLNVTHQVLIGSEETERIRLISGSLATFVADLYEFFRTAYEDHFFARSLAPLHDPCALLAVTHPDLFEFEDRHVVIDPSDGPSRGATVVDERGTKQGDAPNVEVAVGVDRDAIVKLVEQAVGTLSVAGGSPAS